MTDLPVIDLVSAEYEADPYAAFRAARERSWLARVGNGYAVLRNADAKAIMRHPDFRVSFGYVDPEISPYLHQRSKSGLMAADGDRHRRLRGVAVRALRPRVMDSMRPAMRAIIDDLIDGVTGRDECDIVKDLTDPFPARVMMPVLGVPMQDVPRIDKWATDSVAIFDLSRLRTQAAQIEAASREFEAYTAGLIELRRSEPGPDLISELIGVQEEGDKLSEAELLMLVMSLIPAALDTTRGQLGFTMECLVRWPDQWAKLAANPELAPKAVEEGLRFAPSISGITHEAIRDTSYNGFDFPKGAFVGIYPRSVNRDPAVFDNPDEFNIERDSGSQHYTFGFGPHACLGAQLARIEMAEVLGAIARRVATWELAGEVTHQPMSSNGNRTSLPVRFTAR